MQFFTVQQATANARRVWYFSHLLISLSTKAPLTSCKLPSPVDYDSVCSGVQLFPLGSSGVEKLLSQNCVHVSSICQGGHHFHLLGGEKGKEI